MTVGGKAPIAYTLRVAGRLDARWTAWFDGFTVTGDADGMTTLRGLVADQAQLHQVLAKIRDLAVTLVSVEADPAIATTALSDAAPRPARG
ncbi:MAG TPA: hypothetical protein VGK18_17115 [Propionicimonas sp.]|jgi:hypothetical protein|uniref:hypothetical protein n=1 Tax=Propionicimonas sp. TaxID=1955623 RepID=UPI002F41FD99